MQNNAYLVLENGSVFCGNGFGYDGEAIGELVFTTSMTGYMETLTDPGYYGQIVTQTFPLIGNYGFISEDCESDKPYLKAYVVRDWCQHPSNFRCEGLLDTFLKDNKVVGLYGIDTRELTKLLREHGSMKAKITASIDNIDKIVSELKAYKLTDCVKSVTCENEQTYSAEDKKYRVVLWDFGTVKNTIKELTKRGCEVIRVGANTTAKRILELAPDGVLLSNGPGDPTENKEIIAEIKKVLDKKIPTFGICLGHLMMALSQGAKSYKLGCGHHGANQPALNTKTGSVYITSQNHNYAILEDTLPSNARVSFKNVNDGSCEGIEYTDMPAFSIQFYPNECGGPNNPGALFNDFIDLLEQGGRK